MGAGAIMQVSAERKLLAVIRDFVKNQAVAAGAAPGEVDDLIQAVDEAATNIIVHGYREQPGFIEIEVKTEPGLVTVILRDDAPPFDPTQVPKPDTTLPLEQRPIGGLGVHLIRHCVDEFSHDSPKHGGNELALVKYLRKKED
jgi:serine/threonine-protein kinase RsbW